MVGGGGGKGIPVCCNCGWVGVVWGEGGEEEDTEGRKERGKRKKKKMKMKMKMMMKEKRKKKKKREGGGDERSPGELLRLPCQTLQLGLGSRPCHWRCSR